MTLITVVGIGIYLIGHGITKIPNTNVVGGVAMIVGGVLVLVGALGVA